MGNVRVFAQCCNTDFDKYINFYLEEPVTNSYEYLAIFDLPQDFQELFEVAEDFSDQLDFEDLGDIIAQAWDQK